MDWKQLFGKNVDYLSSVCTENIFCPSDYKNVKGWKQKIESVNKKFNLCLKIIKMPALVKENMCGTHHQKIIGSINSDKLYYDDYYCKINRGCYLEIKNIDANVLFIVTENITEEDIKNTIRPS